MSIKPEQRIGDTQLVECVKCRDCGAEKVLPTSRVDLWLKTHEHYKCINHHDVGDVRHICGKLDVHTDEHESASGVTWPSKYQ